MFAERRHEVSVGSNLRFFCLFFSSDLCLTDFLLPFLSCLDLCFFAFLDLQR